MLRYDDIDRNGVNSDDDLFLFGDEYGRLCSGGDDGRCIESGDHTSIQDSLDGTGAEAVLCPGATFELRTSILFTVDDFVTPGFQVLRWYGVAHSGADNGWGFEYPFEE